VPIQDARHWYRTARWVRRSRLQLRTHPLCRFCQDKGIVTAAQIADHITPHKGDANLFWFGSLQSLCLQCHVSAKAVIEKRGFATDIGPDGYPIDRGHPVYRADAKPIGVSSGPGGRVADR
jgi:5-methylcytosine-specific restriction enzyme A